MADAHQHSDLLLQSINFRLLARSGALLELLDCMSHASTLLDAEVYRGEVAFAELLLNLILLMESMCGALERVSEDKSCLLQDGKLVTFLQFAALITPNYRVVDKCAVTGQVFDYSNQVTALLLGEEKAMSVRYGVRLQLTICTQISPVCGAMKTVATYHTRDAGQ